MKKRILQLIGSFHQGGSERQAVSLARLLKNDDSYDIFAATLNKEGVLRGEIAEIGLPEIPEFPLTSFHDFNFVRQVRRCSHFLRENNIDLIHTHDFYTNVFGMAAATLARVPARITSKRETGGMRTRVQEMIEKVAFGRSHAIVVNSTAVRNHLTQRGLRAGKIKVIYNGFDAARFAHIGRDRSTVCRQLGLPEGENLEFFTMTANLRHHVKNVPMLLRAAKRVVESNSNIHFLIAGEGVLAEEVKKLATELGVRENAHFIGRCTDIPALLSVSEVGVLTSSAEGFSNSILEYMAAGKPVVATNVGGASEAVAHGETGYLVASDDDAAMAARLTELLDDKEKAAAFGAAGRKIAAETFSEEGQVSKTIALYESLLKRV